WPLEFLLLGFPPQSNVRKDASFYAWPSHAFLEPTSTSFHVPRPTFHLVAISCSATFVAGLLACALLLRKLNRYLHKPAPAVLSKETIRRIHKTAFRAPFLIPDDDGGGDDTFPALPFAKDPIKQSLFIFWLFVLAIGCLLLYILRAYWVPALYKRVASEHRRLSWTLTLILSAVLANLSAQFMRFIFFIWPIFHSALMTAQWAVFTLCLDPPFAAHLRVTRVPLPRLVDRSAALVSSTISALCGYRLISSRVARIYMLALKSLLVEFPQRVARTYATVAKTSSFPMSWGWWLTSQILVFVLRGDSSWTRPKLVTLVGPSLLVCGHALYKYNRVVVPPRTALQLALEPILQTQRRLAVETAEIHRILIKMERRA
ncbi:hypothetical protein FB45DRAFT_925195, partial [Roridomyces roridus]